MAVEDPSTEGMLYDVEKIKNASLNYLKDLLTNREPKEGYENDLKVIRLLHSKRMNEEIDNDEEFSKDD